ncbi:ribonucleotide reductase beta subunit, partial [Suillus subluteus]
RSFYRFQMVMENIHSEVYSLLLDALVKDIAEQKNLFNAIETIPSMKHKADWALKWCSGSTEFGQQLIAFAVVEGIFFSSSFAAIFWLKKCGLMPGLTFSNELISWDEGLHMEFACTLYGHLHHKPSNTTVTEIISEAVSLEEEFVQDALVVDLIGMKTLLMCQYVRFITDWMQATLHCDKIYHVKNPFDFMDMISMEGKTNFFEKRVSDYLRRMGVRSL